VNWRKFSAYLAKQPRFKSAIDTIRLVRKERGSEASGDFLLLSAIMSLQSNDAISAADYIEKLMLIVPDLRPEHRAVLAVINTRQLPRKRLRLVRIMLRILSIIAEITMKLLGRNLLSCKSLGILYPDKIYAN
jgi:hypothetical protein